MTEVTENSIFDPLAFDFFDAIQQLSTYITENDSPTFRHVIDLEQLKNPTTISRSDLLDSVSKAMLNPLWTLTVVRLFRPIVIDLIGRWTLRGFINSMETNLSNVNTTVHTIELVAKAFSIVLPIVPQVKK
jgi:midasin